MDNLKQAASLILTKWIYFVQKAGIPILLVIFTLAFFSIGYTINNLGMNTDTKDMLSAELPWRKLDLEYEKHFPQYLKNILVVVEAGTPDQALDAAGLLYQRLRRERELFESVYYPNALQVFRESGLLYLDTAELRDLSDSLATIQPFLAKLTRDQSLRGLFAMLSSAIDALEEGEDIEIKPVLIQINSAINAVQNNEPFRVSWQELMSGENSADAAHREFILLQPRLDYGSLLPAAPAIERIQALYEDLDIASAPGAEINLTGSVVLSHEELLSVIKGTKTAMALALFMVIFILSLGLGSVKLILATIISLITGLIFTAAFATLTVGELNLISIAFAVLYIGLGVDFAIHYCLRYKEHLRDGANNRSALNETSVNIGSSLFLCAVSTAIGFFAFIPTDYEGVAELGWIAGFGMFISLIVTLTVIPALLNLFPLEIKPGKKTRLQGNAGTVNFRLVNFPEVHAGKIIGTTSILVMFSALSLTQVHFDHNTLNLQDQANESVKTFRKLLAKNDISPWTGIMIADDKAAAGEYEELFSRSKLVERVLSVDDLIPEKQDEKLSIIDEMALLLGDLPENFTAADITAIEREAALTDFQEKLNSTRLIDPIFPELHENLSELSGEDNQTIKADKLAKLEHSILASLPGRLEALNESLNADFISLGNLPTDLRQRWLSDSGHYRIEIYPKNDMQDNAALREFVKEMQAISPRVIGSPVINLEASDAVAAAFKQAFLYAFIVITLMLYLLFRHKRDVLIVLFPLLAAAIITGGASVLVGIPLNFANVIALPLLLGIGVDSGIHIIHRFRTDLPDGQNLLATSSARAVIVSSLTTMGGIGNLSVSPHAGTASMGLLLTIGIGITLVCMLVVLPSLLALQGKRRLTPGT